MKFSIYICTLAYINLVAFINNIKTIEIMKMKFSKFSKSPKMVNNNLSKDVKDIDFTASIVHVGRILSVSDIDKNRSSKYSYLSF